MGKGKSIFKIPNGYVCHGCRADVFSEKEVEGHYFNGKEGERLFGFNCVSCRTQEITFMKVRQEAEDILVDTWVPVSGAWSHSGYDSWRSQEKMLPVPPAQEINRDALVVDTDTRIHVEFEAVPPVPPAPEEESNLVSLVNTPTETRGKLEDAERLFLSAQQEAKEGFGETDPHVASAYNYLPLKWELKRSPPHGGFKPDHPNQQIVLAEDIFVSGGNTPKQKKHRRRSPHTDKKSKHRKGLD